MGGAANTSGFARVPDPALGLLDFIGGFEAPRGYDTVYANKMAQMPKPLTGMTLAEVIADGPRRTKLFGSSAAGRYQFMTATLQDLRKTLVLMGDDVFTPDFQNRLGFALLQRRGYDKFMAGTMALQSFGLGLAREWASFPVLVACQGAHRAVARGQSFYVGDGVNKSLVTPEAVEAALAKALTLGRLAAPVVASVRAPIPIAPVDVRPMPEPPAAVAAPSPAPAADTRSVWQRMADRLRAAFPVQNKA